MEGAWCQEVGGKSSGRLVDGAFHGTGVAEVVEECQQDQTLDSEQDEAGGKSLTGVVGGCTVAGPFHWATS